MNQSNTRRFQFVSNGNPVSEKTDEKQYSKISNVRCGFSKRTDWKHADRRGSAVILPIILLGILAVVSAGTLKQILHARARQEKNLEKIQLELIRSDVAKDPFLKKFDGQSIMTAELNGLPPYGEGSVQIAVDPTAKSVSVIANPRKIKRINNAKTVQDPKRK